MAPLTERHRVTKRIAFTLIAFALILIGYGTVDSGIYLVSFVVGLLIPIGLLLEVIWRLKSG